MYSKQFFLILLLLSSASVLADDGVNYLTRDLHFRGLPESKAALISPSQMMNERDSLVLKQQYEDINRDYEVKKNHGLVSLEGEKTHSDQISSFSRNLVNQIQQKEITRQREKLKPTVEGLRKDKGVMEVAKPVAVAGAIVGVYYGHPFDLNLGHESTMSVRAHFPSQTAQFQLSAFSFTSSMELRVANPANRNPASIYNADPATRVDERVKFSLLRPLPWWGISSGFSFLGTSKVLLTTFQKEIYPHVNCAVDSFFPMDVNNSDIKVPGNTVKVFYGIHF